MATEPPRSTGMKLPKWLWGGAVQQFLADAQLTALHSAIDGDEVVVEAGTVERLGRTEPDLVTVTDMIKPVGSPRPQVLTAAENTTPVSLSEGLAAGLDQVLQQMNDRISPASQVGLIAPALNFIGASVQLSRKEVLLNQIVAGHADLGRIGIAETGEPAFPSPTVHFVQRALALVHRTRFPAVLLRMEHDDRLKNADLGYASAAARHPKLSASRAGSRSRPLHRPAKVLGK